MPELISSLGTPSATKLRGQVGGAALVDMVQVSLHWLGPAALQARTLKVYSHAGCKPAFRRDT